MKKITLLLVLLISSLGFAQQQEYVLDFESDGQDGIASNWYTFDNDPAPAEIVDNPDLDGVNAAASKVMKVVVGPDNAFYAGVNNKWEDSKFGSWKIDMSVTSNLTLTMDVNKNYVGTVGIKMGTNSAGTTFQITDQNVGNSVVDEWQTLTFDLSGINPNGDLSNISQMVVFVDWTDGAPNRAAGNTIYIDNIKFNAEKLTDPVVGGGDTNTSTPEGTWMLTANAGALGVGPTQGDTGWWASSEGDVTARACLFDDEYVFETNGTFQNVLGSDTWLEGWQGVADACGTPVAPHDSSNAAAWVYDSSANTITITGKGAYLGIAKPNNGGELTNPADAPASITYIVSSISDTEMTLDLNYGTGFWRFLFTKETATASVIDNSLTKVSLYPNPTSNRLNISAADTIKNAEIYNLLGKRVMSLNINNTSESIDVSNLASGIYLIKYEVNNAVGTSKFIKK